MAGVITAIVLLCITVGVNDSFCQDFFMGKVLSINSQKKEIEVAPQISTTKQESGIEDETVLVQSKIALPACVIIGANIRLWGKRLPGAINTFIATDIRGCRGGGCSDPTGVRSRLSRKGKQHRSYWSDTDSTERDSDSYGAESGGGRGGGGGGNGGGGGGR
jgi:uncharacterized membrane protein YgcG